MGIQKLTIGIVFKMLSMEVVHTKAIAALTQFCDFFFTNRKVIFEILIHHLFTASLDSAFKHCFPFHKGLYSS